MNREILFRGKCLNDKFGWKLGGIAMSGGRYFIITPPSYPRNQESYEVYPETVGQFTGLLDKNGTKIFEGDIIQTFKLASDGSKTGNTRRVVDFKGASFVSWLMMFPDDKDWWTAQLDPKWIKEYEFEITGNIHETK